MTYIFYDFESSGKAARFDKVLQAGFIVYDSALREKKQLNIRSRINSDVIPSINALKVNRLKMRDLLWEDLSSYQMTLKIYNFLNQFSKSFYIGYNSINFDEELIRKEFFKNIRYPYVTNSSPNFRHDGINIARGAFAIDPNILQTEINEKNNPVFKLESLARMQGIDSSDAHSALADAEMTTKILNIVKKKYEYIN